MDILNIALSTYLAFGQPISGAGNAEAIVRHGGLQAIHADGSVTLRLEETGRTKKNEDGGTHWTISLQDEAYPFTVTRHVKSYGDTSAVETWVEIRHDESAPVRLVRMDSFAARLPGKQDTVRVMSLTGKWAYEANVYETEAVPGQIVELASRAGTRDAWESNAAFMLSLGSGVTESSGEVLGVALEWTGTTSRRVRRIWGGATEVFAGVDNASGPYVLNPGKTLVLPKAILVHSTSGKGEISRQYHKWARRHLMPHGTALHPILLNSWEGSYFSFTEKTLTDMMDGVREMGGEMFVLDDGWFGHGKYARDDKNRDRVGLGDWHVNPEKLPHGLGWLSDEAKKRGLKFGIWVEPEMTNVKSWLADAHPDWLLREPKRDLVLGRGGTQTVLDLTNPAVRENLFGQLDAVFSDIPDLAYVKWDSNQHISNPGSTYLDAAHQPNLWFDYTKGLYELVARLQAKRPNTMIQACSAGGGHMDFGFLRYADEFWTSDDTDPLRRVFIQWGASMFYPACAMACHVTDSPNHFTKRVTPLSYRFDVAMCGRMGFELHPSKLTTGELEYAKGRVAQYKRIRPVVQQGDLYRLASPYENPYSSLMYVSEAKDRAVFFVLGLDKNITVETKIRLAGLDPERRYVVRGDVLTGRELMDEGLSVSLKGEYASDVVEIEEAPLASAVSPDGRNAIRLWTNPLSYDVTRDGIVVAARTPINLTVDGALLIGSAEESTVTTRRIEGVEQAAVYRKGRVDVGYVETLVAFPNGGVRLAARNDGVAYRFESGKSGEITVNAEQATLKIPDGAAMCWGNYGVSSGNEETIGFSSAAKDVVTDGKRGNRHVYLPFVYSVSGKTVLFSETDVRDYPILNLRRPAASVSDVSFGGSLDFWPTAFANNDGVARESGAKRQRHWHVKARADYLVRTEGTRTFPWRVFALVDAPAQLASSDIFYALSRPAAQEADFSWVKPGKVAWDWWNAFDNIGDPEGCTTKTYERFIDFAAKNGVEYVIMDEGWSAALNIWKFSDKVDVPHLIDYAAQKGVGIILWMAWAQVEGDEERVVDHFAKLGAKGFKVDFMDRGDAACERFLWKFAEVCARHHMLIDYHGAHRPTGLSRTYPNVLNYEGVHGLEMMKFYHGQRIVENDVRLCFGRMTAGPMDYTPGAMDNYRLGEYLGHMNKKETRHAMCTNPGSLGTRARQMAMLVAFEAPLQMLCDSPTKYEKNAECFAFMAKTPVVWDDTVGLDGTPDSFFAIARRAKDGSWYVAALGNDREQAFQLDTSFLGSGEWKVESFADRLEKDAPATAYLHREGQRVKAGEKLPVRLAPAGGFVARFVK